MTLVPTLVPTPRLALGVLAVPSDVRQRDSIRATWFQDDSVLQRLIAARFVIGAARPCERSRCDKEARRHGDIAFVNASDCAPWHASHKVHAWYQWAMQEFSAVPWIGKLEDDTLIAPSILLADLAIVQQGAGTATCNDAHGTREQRCPSVDYYGVNFQWIAHCRQHSSGSRGSSSSGSSSRAAIEAPLTVGWSARSCAQGCWLDTVHVTLTTSRNGNERVTSGRPRRCETSYDRRPVVQGSADCGSLSYGPFAPGPLEVRSRRLASLIGSCAYADEYFVSLATRGALIKDECASTDGAQGHVIAECIASSSEDAAIAIADGGGKWHRQSHPDRGTAALLRRELNASFAAAPEPPPYILHPIKQAGFAGSSDAAWRSFWGWLRDLPPRQRPPIALLQVEWPSHLPPDTRRTHRPLAIRVGVLGTAHNRRATSALLCENRSSARSRNMHCGRLRP